MKNATVEISLKSLFSQLGHANEGSHSIDEETVSGGIHTENANAATTLRLFI
jgi:hypothetical protein